MKAIEVLQEEHEVILSVLDAVEREALEIQKTGQIHADTIDRMVDFFRNFTDRCHHGKEEKYLFVKMQERLETSTVEPITSMLKDHEEGRFQIKSLVQALLKAYNKLRPSVCR